MTFIPEVLGLARVYCSLPETDLFSKNCRSPTTRSMSEVIDHRVNLFEQAVCQIECREPSSCGVPSGPHLAALTALCGVAWLRIGRESCCLDEEAFLTYLLALSSFMCAY